MLELPDGEHVLAAAEIWRRGGRQIDARFGGTSMLPSIGPGEPVRIACGGAVAMGDVAVLLEARGVLVHRVGACDARRGWILTRGDACLLPDLPAPMDRVLGRLCGVQRGGLLAAIGPPPDSAARRAFLAVCLGSLRVSPRAGRAFVRGLWFLRRWLFAMPAAVWRRLLRLRARSDEQEQP